MTDAGTPPSPDDQDWQRLTTTEVAARLGSSVVAGLDRSEADRRIARDGPNVVPAIRGRRAVTILVEQLRSPVVVLLLAAAAVALAFGDRLEAFAILVVIGLNAGVGFWTDWRAERALRLLERGVIVAARVIRDGHERSCPAGDLVPGDLVVLDAGMEVPADGRLVEAVALRVDEAILTGESVPVDKITAPIEASPRSLPDLRNMVWRGTLVTAGRGKLLVTATGAATEVGRIGAMLMGQGRVAPPLQRQLAAMSRALVLAVVVIAALILGIGLLRGVAEPWGMVEVAIALAVAAAPEGLPAVATLTLALGMLRMARRRAIIRRLPAAEALGCATVICTDKTGTLTRNEMVASRWQLADRRLDLDGDAAEPDVDANLRAAARVALLCNDAERASGSGVGRPVGDPTEQALLDAVQRLGIDVDDVRRTHPRLAELPFDPMTQRMTTVHRGPDGRGVAMVKGAPEAVLAASVRERTTSGERALDRAARRRWHERNRQLAGSGLRVLALASRKLPAHWSMDEAQRELTLVGLVGMTDPIRPEVPAALTACRAAGIRTVMLTGDHADTAAAVARQLRLLDRDADADALVAGGDLRGLDDAGWDRVVGRTTVFARVTPADKLQIVTALQRRGEIVAMTGDGVNDAPALRRADIGVAMGIKGTDVARAAADMVITDDNFATIVAAIEEGRIIHANILRAIRFLFSCNLSEIIVVAVAIVGGWPLPLAALQLLWLNLVTDVFPALALAVDPTHPDIMHRPPRDPSSPLLTHGMVAQVGLQALLLAGLALGAFAAGWYGVAGPADQGRATTLAFMTLALAQVAHAHNVRSTRRSALGRAAGVNRWLTAATLACVVLQLTVALVAPLRELLDLRALALADWGLITVGAITPVLVTEIVKAIVRPVDDAGWRPGRD